VPLGAQSAERVRRMGSAPLAGSAARRAGSRPGAARSSGLQPRGRCPSRPLPGELAPPPPGALPGPWRAARSWGLRPHLGPL